jgi:hypothetical protein
VHHHVFFAVELSPHRPIEGLHPRREISRADGHPQQARAVVALDVGVIGCLDGERDDLKPIRQAFHVLRHSTRDRRGRGHHVEATQEQSRQVAHGRPPSWHVDPACEQ